MKLRLLFTPIAFVLLSMKPEVIKIEEVYEDPENLLLRSEIIELPSKSIDDLKVMVDNWGETSLANTKEYWADKSESSVRFSFLLPFETAGLFNTTVTVHYYVVFLVEYKEGKVRYKIYDDGNEYEPATENTKERHPTRSPRFCSFCFSTPFSASPCVICTSACTRPPGSKRRKRFVR